LSAAEITLMPFVPFVPFVPLVPFEPFEPAGPTEFHEMIVTPFEHDGAVIPTFDSCPSFDKQP
jgi:hypothetical protein